MGEDSCSDLPEKGSMKCEMEGVQLILFSWEMVALMKRLEEMCVNEVCWVKISSENWLYNTIKRCY